MKVKVLFFGVLAEKTGKDAINVEDALDLDSLKSTIVDDYPGIKEYTFRVSVNRDICKANVRLNDGDEVAFLPPFAGG